MAVLTGYPHEEESIRTVWGSWCQQPHGPAAVALPHAIGDVLIVAERVSLSAS
ncbi:MULTISPECIES: hypothetical protein [Streptomyces]|uniref:hypothetical protein n=1 Tax=Streptomyces TaxID=1883 RepID=UPI002E0D969E|nr:hypothetical protein OG722_08565 [Streptomyces sp. NBC_01212]